MTVFYFYDKRFSQVLNLFQKKANADKNTQRLDYSTWRELVKVASSNTSVEAILNPLSNTWSFNGDEYSSDKLVNLTYDFVQVMQDCAAEIEYDSIEEEENDTMTNNVAAPARKMPAMNIDFGPMSSNIIAMSPYGLAVRNHDGSWLTYNAASGQTVDVTGFTFEFENMIYKMPAAVTSIAPGDMILHQNRPMFVTEVGKHIEAVDILDSEAKTIIPVTNMFGFNFVTKIVSFINLGNAQPSADQPFGNLMPMMMAQMVFNGDSEMDFGKMMMLSMMMGGANPFANMFNFGTAAPEVGSAS